MLLDKNERWEAVQIKKYSDRHLEEVYADKTNQEIIANILEGALELISPKKTDKILEIGAGNGVALGMLKAKGFQNLCGLDLVEENRLLIESRGINAVLGSVTKMPFTDNEFDLVYGFNILHHIQDIDNALKEIKRVAKKAYVFHEPNIINPVAFLFGLEPGERKRYRLLLRKFKKNGLNSQIKYKVVPPYNLLFKLKLPNPKKIATAIADQFEKTFPKSVYPTKYIYGVIKK